MKVYLKVSIELLVLVQISVDQRARAFSNLEPTHIIKEGNVQLILWRVVVRRE